MDNNDYEIIAVGHKGTKREWLALVRRPDGTLDIVPAYARSKHSRIRKGVLLRIYRDKEHAALKRILLYKETLEQKEQRLLEWALHYGPDHVVRAIIEKDPRWVKMARRAYYRQRALAQDNKR
jgi:hypothetical protein